MNQNLILGIIATFSWVLIIYFSLIGAHFENTRDPKAQRGVSIFPGLPFMPIITFGIGFSINLLMKNLGTLIVSIVLGVYILLCLIEILKEWKKTQKWMRDQKR